MLNIIDELDKKERCRTGRLEDGYSREEKNHNDGVQGTWGRIWKRRCIIAQQGVVDYRRKEYDGMRSDDQGGR